jgi:hypothetical protein
MTVVARRELVSPALRNAFRSLAMDLTIRAVEGLCEDHGFAPNPPEELKYDDPRRRRTTFMLFADGVDWTSPDHVRRALVVAAPPIPPERQRTELSCPGPISQTL